MRNRSLLLMLAVATLLFAFAIAAQAGDDQLKVVQDESSMEQTIERYLKANHQLVVNEKTLEEDDLYLELPYEKSDTIPGFRITIDTQSLNKDPDSGEILERGILINLYTGISIPKEDYAKALEAINEWNRKKAFSSIFIDTDGEVVCCWVLNVMSEGLPTEYVFDTVYRVQLNWKNLYPLLTEAINASPQINS
jgi:hypothetical protein